MGTEEPLSACDKKRCGEMWRVEWTEWVRSMETEMLEEEYSCRGQTRA